MSFDHFSTHQPLIVENVGQPLVTVLSVKIILKGWSSSKRTASCGEVSWILKPCEKIQRCFSVHVLLGHYRHFTERIQTEDTYASTNALQYLRICNVVLLATMDVYLQKQTPKLVWN
jgi:hypothetical protein